MIRYFFTLFFSLSFLGFTGCNNNPLRVDISGIEADITINRFDLALYNIQMDSLMSEVQKLENEFGKFFDLYNQKIISIGSPSDEGYEEYLTAFLTDFTILETYKETNTLFKDLRWLEKELEEVLQYYKYYFPDQDVPEFYSYISGFNQSVVVTEDFIGIGLDKYLGEKHAMYEALQIPKYLRYKMQKGKIVSDCAYALGTREIIYNDSIDNLLSHMIHEGKLMYFTDAMLPDVPDSVKIGYTTEHIKWCNKYEKDMWTYMIEKKHLFSTDLMVVKRYIDESPFTKSFSAESPGRTGIWIGWQIVRNYMKNNPDVSLQDLIENSNYQEILNKSKYNP